MSTVNAKISDEKQAVEVNETIDYKMVTFSLAGKDYGIDIMTVKEISKASKFTYVPNSVPYVRGVYNLRGEIISVIDLRLMLNLPIPERKKGELENMIILRLQDYLIGIIVDSIDKVVGIPSKSIQPPHPLFGDINIKYIRGVVDNGNRLYIILDAERILGSGSFEEEQARFEEVREIKKPILETRQEDVNKSFINETLATFKSFYVTNLNQAWIEKRFNEWIKDKKGDTAKIQLKDETEANDFLRGFYSPYSGEFWGEDYIKKLAPVLDNLNGKMITVWNPGCGKGYESYSGAAMIKAKFPNAQLKIWANDNDLLSISTAPSLIFQRSELPDFYNEYIAENQNGFQFIPDIKDVILFEYHDILHQNPLPSVDIIIARDMLSFLKPANQQKMVKEFWEKLKPEGVLILGWNETDLDNELFEELDGLQGAYKKIV